MFELSVALRYLLPRKKQLSVSIISLLSVVVIALVVWLVVVFLSVTEGIEKRWVNGLVSLNAPIRLTPTDAYYHSYFYQIDSQSSASNYTFKTIGEKRWSEVSDPYDPKFDSVLPASFATPDLDGEGRLRDPVRGTFEVIKGLPVKGIEARDFEVTLGNLRLRLLRNQRTRAVEPDNFEQSFLSQVSYLGAFDGDNTSVAKTVMTPSNEDLTHLLHMLRLSGENAGEETPELDGPATEAVYQERLKRFLDHAHVSAMKTGKEGWVIPKKLYPQNGEVAAKIEKVGPLVRMATLGEGEQRVVFKDGRAKIFEGEEELVQVSTCPLIAPAEMVIPVDEQLVGDFSIGEARFAGKIPHDQLHIAKANVATAFNSEPTHPPLWSYRVGGVQVVPQQEGHGILLAKSFRDGDVHIGDRGYISYYAGTPSSVQEQRVPVYVAGFYDPGLTPLGGKMVLVDREITGDAQGAITQIEQRQGNGIHVWFSDMGHVDQVKEQLTEQLATAGLLPYWKVESYKEYDFAKPLVQQFQSDRNLFFLIAIIVIVVACSNIISMLILLVNDKRREIGILQSMGATRKSIGMIFALCGIAMGTVGSLVGIGSAILTLQHLDKLVSLLSALQGHEAFQSLFYGETLPNELSTSVLGFVVLATVIVSLIAGVIPAVKATLVKPSTILRAG